MNPRYPIMAALLAASLGTVSLGTSHAAPPPCPEVNASEKNPVNILAGIICRDDKAKADVGERFAAFVLMMDGANPRFVSEDIRKDEAKKAKVADAAKTWPKLATPSQVAELYYVMGDGAPAAWVTANAVLKDKVKAATNAEADRRKGLVPALEKWRDANEGRIAWVNFADNTNLFLKHAAQAARAILSDSRTRADLDLSIARNESAPVVPVGPGRRASDFTPFDPSYMYANGGKNGSLLNSKGEPVPYNIKLETTKDNAGVPTTNVVIYDLSQSPVYMQRIPIRTRGETPINIGSPQHNWNLVVDIKSGQNDDLAISLRKAADTEGKEAIRTTANELAQARVDQAVTAGQIVDIGGESFYMSAQGGKDGSYLYYPTSLAGRTGASWADMTPAHVAIIAKIGPDGRFVPVAGSPNIGTINGKPYKLEYNAVTGRWVPADGEGTMPPKEAAPAATSTTGALADRASAAASADKWVLDAVTDGLSAATKEKGYRIHSQPNPNDSTQMLYNILTPPGFVNGNSITFAGITNLRAFGHYIAWQRGSDHAYQDLLVKTMLANEKGEKRASFDMIARITGGVLSSVTNPVDGIRRSVEDHDVLMDGLKVLKFTDAQIKTTVDNVKSQVSGGKYFIESAAAGKVIIQIPPNKVVQVYPAIAAAPSTENPQVQGAGTAVDVASGPGGADVPFLETFDVALPNAFMKLKRVKMDGDNPATASAALYVKETAQEADAQWFLYVKYREDVPATATTPASKVVRRSNHILVFSNTSDPPRLKRPDLAKLSVKGQTSYESTIDPKIVSVSLVVGSTLERGAWTLHKAPASQVGKDNCVGPVVWWGLTEAAAKDAGCVKGKFN